MDMVRMSISETKLEEMTVTRHPINPSSPNMTVIAKTQLHRGNATKRNWRKMQDSISTRKMNTPAPNTARSFLMKVIMSSAIIDTPPRCRAP